MKSRPLVTVVLTVAAGAAAWAVRLGAQPPAAPPPAPPAGAPLRIQGVGGCAAAGCHNLQGPAGSSGSEYSAWVHDPHGRANETVQSAPYRAILGRLRNTPYTEELCLKCHATPTPDGSPLPRELLADGVGCESCHGPAEKWRTVHYQGWWTNQDPERKWQEYGLFPTKDLARRVAKCAECHVGTPDKDVNHDLIAAGHPRLAWEATAYHQLLPRHWREPHEKAQPAPDARRDWAAHAWLIGQAVTAKAAVGLVRARAGYAGRPAHPWPEFTEYGCFACHHDLKPGEGGGPNWRQRRGFEGSPGELPWGTWVRPMPAALARVAPDFAPPGGDPFADLAALLRQPYPAPKDVPAKADPALGKLDAWLKHVREAPPLDAAGVRKLLASLAADGLRHPPREWDDAAQRYLALAALYQALGEIDPAAATPARHDLFRRLRAPLAFPADKSDRKRYDSPVAFTPDKYLQALQPFATEFRTPDAP